MTKEKRMKKAGTSGSPLLRPQRAPLMKVLMVGEGVGADNREENS